MAESKLHLCFDLGGDTLKVSYAFKLGKTINYGKLAGKGNESFPAVAYYDRDENKWLYADEVGRKNIQSYITLVKIKTLIKFLQKNNNRKILAKNGVYYREKNVFPKFYFPEKKKLLDDVSKSEESGMTFVANGFTPQKVCEGFFAYICKEIRDSIASLEKAKAIQFSSIVITIVYPFNIGVEYVTELKRLIGNAFGIAISAAISSPKALSLFAYHRGQMNMDDKVLVFDMGEEQLSVVKASRYSSGLALDCVDGHNLPLDIGGINIDEAIADYLEKSIERRETIGTPSYGDVGHVNESGSYAMQYQLMKEIKCAKKYFSSDVDGDYWKRYGVPIRLYRETVICRRLTLDDFENSIGLKGEDADKSVVAKIIKYIVRELKRPINQDVTKIFFAGGLAETYGLLELIVRRLRRYNKELTILTFDDFNVCQDGYSILSHEDSAYASATGGAVVSLCAYKTNTVFSVSYGTWVYRRTHQELGKILSIFVERGECAVTDRYGCCKKLTKSTYTGDGVGEEIKFEMIFSVNVTSQEIIDGSGAIAELSNEERRKYYFKGSSEESAAIRIGNERYEFGEKSKLSANECELVDARETAKKVLGLKVLSGGKDSAIWFYYMLNGQRVRIGIQKGIYFKEGIIIDADGRAMPYIENDKDANKAIGLMQASLLDNKSHATGKIIYVNAKDIELKFEKLEDFDGYSN